MEAYFDNSATTRCMKPAADLMMKVLQEDFGNPSALHNRGMEAEKYIREARSRIAKTLKVNEREIFLLPAEQKRIILHWWDVLWQTGAVDAYYYHKN